MIIAKQILKNQKLLQFIKCYLEIIRKLKKLF